MNLFFTFAGRLHAYKWNTSLSILFHLLTAVLTVVSIPIIIPFFQILFDRELDLSTVDNGSWLGRLKLVFGELIQNHSAQDALMSICVILLLIFFLKNVCRYLAMYFMTPVRNGIVRDLRSEVFSSLMQLPVAFFKQRPLGDLMSVMGNDVQEIEWSILHFIEALFKSPLIIIGSLAIMLYISPLLTSFVLLMLLFTILIIGGISRTLKKKSYKAQEYLGKILNRTEEMISGYKVVKGYDAESFFKSRFEDANEGYFDIHNRVLWRRDASSPLTEFLGILVVICILYFGASQVFSQQLQPEVFFAFVFAFYQVIEPAKSFSTAYYNIQKGLAAMQRVTNIFDEEKEEVVSSIDGAISFEENIRFDHVSFAYQEETEKVLDNSSIEIHKGSKVAILGRSGIGKSTIVDLLCRYYEPDSGKIMIDDRDIKTYPRKTLRNLITIIPQHPVLFNSSILTNIVLSETYDETRLQQVCRIVQAQEFIDALPENIHSNIGNNGMKLSGGQRQRISLARALYCDAPIMVFDEATSALDVKTESQLFKDIAPELAGKTVIIISHRLNPYLKLDAIWELMDGRTKIIP